MHILYHKSLLAKLLATENIMVETRKVSTASFDLKTRTLTLPNWDNVSEYGYDLLVGHEVGHALDTPYELWNNAIKENGNLRSFINVVEDARIEKRIKRRYPGLRNSFNIGYAEFLKSDIFGIAGRDINEMYFIDRLNIHSKAGVLADVRFSKEEKQLVSLVESAETFEQVVAVAKLIYEFSKKEQQKPEKYSDSEDNFDDQFGDNIDSESEQDTEETDETEEYDSSENADEASDYNSEENEEDSEYADADSQDRLEEEYEPICETDESFERKRAELSKPSYKDNFYAKLPQPILKNIVTPVKRVQELLSEHFEPFPGFVSEQYLSFTKRNSRYIDLLAKEFEMRKAAKIYAKRKVSSSGDLDISKIYKYKTDDNIFRSVMTVPNGKNHGLVVLLDRSGSMSDNMKGSLEQLVVLSQFCKKVGIPFIVYGFGDNREGRIIDSEVSGDEIVKHFTSQSGELKLHSTYLREYLNSNMNQAAFSKACKNIIALSATYNNSHFDPVTGKYIYTPRQEALSRTPLNESLVALAPIAKQFKNRYKLDIVNTIIIQDGDADSISPGVHDVTYSYWDNLIISEKVNNQIVQINFSESSLINQGFLNWYTSYTDSKAIGFFITNKRQRRGLLQRWIIDDYCKKQIPRAELLAQYQYSMKQHRFVARDVPSYNKFFYLDGGSLVYDQDELDIDSSMSVTKMKSAFLKMNQSKSASRALVTQLMGIISV